jgi:hypothetical protein
MQRFLKKIKMQMSMAFQEKKVTRHVGEWILNTYSPTANFGRICEWASGYPQHCICNQCKDASSSACLQTLQRPYGYRK